MAAIMAIQGAGLGVSQAIWSALGVLVAFAWGSLVFAEPVGNLPLSLTGSHAARWPKLHVPGHVCCLNPVLLGRRSHSAKSPEVSQCTKYHLSDAAYSSTESV